MRYRLGISVAGALATLVVGWSAWSLSTPVGGPAPTKALAPATAPGQSALATTPSPTSVSTAPTPGAATGLGGTAGTQPAPTLTEGLDLLPADTLLCWYGRPFPDAAEDGATSKVQAALQWISHALSNEARMWARGLEAFNLAIQHPHIFALIDARGSLDTSGEKPVATTDYVAFALIVETHGQDEAFARVIQAAINEQTDREKAHLTRCEVGHWSYMELRDQRLPPWCVFAWGNIAPFFVFTIGPDVWPGIAAVAAGEREALSHTRWMEEARDSRARNALIEIIVRSQEIRDRLDPFVDGRASTFFNAWHAQDIERAHWALGFEGRAMYCVATFLENGQVRKRLLADPDIRNAELLATIPEGARYAIYQIAPAEALPRFFNGLLATRSQKEQRNIKRLWEQIQKERGFDAERDILAHMGKHIVMHNEPPHPLHIPLAMTTLTEIREEPAQVSRAIDALSEAWRDAQEKFRAATGDENGVIIDRESDGIWYIEFGPGLAGPAWAVTDRFLITSWSPTALRSYLEKVGSRAGRRLSAVAE